MSQKPDPVLDGYIKVAKGCGCLVVVLLIICIFPYAAITVLGGLLGLFAKITGHA